MAGTIGLTPAGIALDESILHLSNQQEIYRFIGKFTKLTKEIHNSNCNEQCKLVLFTLIRKEYLAKMEKFELSSISTSLMRNYITTLTKIDFVPSTKTQLAL